MSPDQRRAQLLDTGEKLFGEGRFEELSMEDIAGHAGVTRALLYHYFPTKADFFGAIWQRAHESISTTLDLDAAPTARDGLVTALTAYLDFYETHLPLVLIANRSAIASAPVVRAPVERAFRVLCEGVLDAVGATGHRRRLAEAAFTGWIAFVRETTLTALVDRGISPAENLAMCVAALDSTVGAYADLGPPSRSE